MRIKIRYKMGAFSISVCAKDMRRKRVLKSGKVLIIG